MIGLHHPSTLRKRKVLIPVKGQNDLSRTRKPHQSVKLTGHGLLQQFAATVPTAEGPWPCDELSCWEMGLLVSPKRGRFGFKA